jgi:glycosyltransferase involved in cell wall biosynthesis
MPDISIIIPTFNRAAQLADTLMSIAREVGAANPAEVIVVDNGSTDGTKAAFETVTSAFPKHEWRYVYEPMPGLLSGRHRGANEAQGEILAYLDDDVVLSASWFDGLVDAFSKPEVALVGGPSLPEYENTPPEWLECLWYRDADGRRTMAELSLIDAGGTIRREDPLYVFGLNFSIRKVIYHRCGGFHPDNLPTPLRRYRGDGETGLSLKLKAAGLAALYHPQVALKHIIPANRMTVESIEQRCFSQGISDSYTLIRREGITALTQPRIWKDLIRPLKRRFHREYLLRKGDLPAIRKLMGWAHAAGYACHQIEVLRDPKLLQWVTKPNYLDYALPEGWQGYITSSNSKLRVI